MSRELRLAGEMIEIGRLEDENGLDGLAIQRADGSIVTIKGLNMDEVKSIAHHFAEQVTISIRRHIHRSDTMSAIETGGPAFPIPGLHNDSDFNGMTLRDYFAAKAMTGICAHTDTWGFPTSEKIATASYQMADAMLIARKLA